MARIVTIRQNRSGKPAVNKQAVAKAKRSPESKVDARTTQTPQGWVNSGAWVRVKSSNVVAIRYDKADQILWVKFGVKTPTTSKYVYYGVHPNTAKSMFNAASMGKFVWRKLRDKYPYARVED